MDKAFVKEMEERLVAERDRLKGDLESFTSQNPKNAQDYNADFPNLGDKEDENAEEVDTFSTNLTLERTLESSLRDIDDSLERIAKGVYGTCKYCGKDIDQKRLSARPSSSSCIECKKNFTREM